MTVGSVVSTPALQARYIALFTHLGLADSAFDAKPALGGWDSALARPYSP